MGRTTRKTTGTLTFSSDVEFSNVANKITTTELTTADERITLNKNGTSIGSAGIEVEKSGSIASSLVYDDAGSGKWSFTGAGAIDFNNSSFENFSLGTIASADINSGTIDGTTIGATSHSTGKFTDLTATGTVNLGSGSVSATTFSLYRRFDRSV